jgi:NAD(P)H dehydrogenase (quinone)
MPNFNRYWPDFLHRADPVHLDIGTEQANAARTAGFAPDVQAEIDKLMAADFLLLQFPFWWYSVPAMLKGWIDRVFAYGVAYDFGRTWDRGVFRGRRAMLAFTTSAPPTSSFPDGRNGDLERTLWPLHAGVPDCAATTCCSPTLHTLCAGLTRPVAAPSLPNTANACCTSQVTNRCSSRSLMTMARTDD